jgi:hypothetical protein
MEWIAYCRQCYEELGFGRITGDLRRNIEEHFSETGHTSICLVNAAEPFISDSLEYGRDIWDEEKEEYDGIWDHMIRNYEESKDSLGYLDRIRILTESELEEWRAEYED